MADAFGLRYRHTEDRAAADSDREIVNNQWAWGYSLGHKQNNSERKAGRCMLYSVGAALFIIVLLGAVFVPSAESDYLVQAPEIAELYYPYGHQSLESVRDDTGAIAESFKSRKMHARLRRAMNRACHGHPNASTAVPSYFMATEFVLRSSQQDNAIVRHFPYRMGCVCRFNSCIFLEDPVVLYQNEYKNVKFMCSDTVKHEAVKTIRALPYKVLNSDGLEFVARTVEEVCQVGMLVDVLAATN